MHFGVTVLPDPPYTDLVRLFKQAEDNGFEIGWTYDSHVLWQDPYPILTAAALGTTNTQARYVRDEPWHA